MKYEPLVSVVVAAYNAEAYISECIDSIIKQTYPNWELIICDDASNDKTRIICNGYAETHDNIKVIYNETNKHAAYSRNRCIELASGELIAIQDADDLSEKNRLELEVEAILTSKSDFVSSAHYLFDGEGVYSTYYPKEKYPSKKSFLSGLPFCHAATMFKQECIKGINGYRDDKFTIRNEDYDLFMRLYASGFKGVNVFDVLYGYRVDKNALTRRTFKHRISECKIRYMGFKNLDILFPIGWIYVFKPILAYFVQRIKQR